jgi:GntR family transcriptional regulator
VTAGDRAPFALDQFLYLQVAERIAERIRGGEFAGDGRLPSEPELCEHYGVGTGVIRHARQELMRRGLIFVDPDNRGNGTFTA